MKTLRNFLVKLLEWFLIAAFAVLVLDVLWGVITRALGDQSPWTEEIAIYMIIWVSLLGAALTFEDKGHLGVDYIVNKFHPDAQRVAAIFVQSMVLLFAGVGLLYGGWLFADNAFNPANGGLAQTTAVLKWKTGYWYLAAPLSGFFTILFSMEELVEIFSGNRKFVDSNELKGEAK